MNNALSATIAAALIASLTDDQLLAAATVAFNAGQITMEQAFSVVDTVSIRKLVAKVKSTNNGYLFAPDENDIAVAKANPSVFFHTFNPQPGAIFPHRIALA